MSAIDKIRKYIMDDEFVFHFSKNRLNIINYTSISELSRSSIKIKYGEGEVIVTGTKLVVTKLINDELLINGCIEKIELR